MSTPVRSIRLQKRSSESLNILSGSAGEIFFDSDQGALRLYTSNNNERKILADRTWVQNNTFAGDYNDLENKPVLSTVAISGDYNDLINTPDLGAGSLAELSDVVLAQTVPVDHVLTWDGTNWINKSVGSILDTNTTYSISAGVGDPSGASIVLVGSDSSSDAVRFEPGTNITITRVDANTIRFAAAVGSLSLNSLTDVDTSTTPPTTGQVLKFNGTNWVPGDDVTGGGAGLDADTLDGFDSTYFLNYNNLTNLPTIPSTLTDLNILDGSIGQFLRTDGAGNFTFQTITIPTELTDLGIADGAFGQVLTTDGAGNFTFQTVSSGGTGATTLNELSDVDTTGAANGSILKFNGTTWVAGVDNEGAGTDTGLITFTNATIATSTTDPITFDDSIIANGNITVNGEIESITGTSPEIFSNSTITLNAATRTEVITSPFKLAGFTTLERDALTAENGDLIYNTDTNKIQGYQNGGWINLDGTV